MSPKDKPFVSLTINEISIKILPTQSKNFMSKSNQTQTIQTLLLQPNITWPFHKTIELNRNATFCILFWLTIVTIPHEKSIDLLAYFEKESYSIV